MELVILIALQAAGKTTFRRRRFDRTHVVVSKDDFPNNRRPARRQQFLVREALAAGKPVVVDNTNPRREDRALLIALAHAACQVAGTEAEEPERERAGRESII
jgi:predicted kinase